jgi:hypothetical protein
MASRVSNGIFFGMTASELERVRRNLVQSLIDFGPERAVALNVNSNSFSFAERGGMTIDRWQSALREAFHEIDPDGWPDHLLDRTAINVNYGIINRGVNEGTPVT